MLLYEITQVQDQVKECVHKTTFNVELDLFFMNFFFSF